MKHMKRWMHGWVSAAGIGALAMLSGGCGGGAEQPAGSDAAHRAAEAHEPAPTNRIDIPAPVRSNLGITFAKVERRPVRQTLRLPGAFELRPEARREYRAMLPARVDLHVAQLQRVEPGALLFTLDSPQWRELQHEVIEAEGEIRTSEAALQVAIAQQDETVRAAAFLRQRIEGLQAVQMRKVELEAELESLENQLPRLSAEIEAKRVAVAEANEHYRSRLQTMASLLGTTVDALLTPVESPGAHGEAMPRWRSLHRIEVRANAPGVVEHIDVTNGGWIETGGLALTVVDPAAIRFRAQALQADLARLHSGQAAQIVPPQGGTLDPQQAIDATLQVGFQGTAEDRTIPVFALPQTLPIWARPGVAAFLEIFTDDGASAELAIPEAAVVRDGLVPVIFRRDPRNPDQVIRIEADLGPSDGRWVVIQSGVKQGDEIVLDGAYQLMLATSGAVQKGGHFHADGTFHADEH